MPDRIVPAEVLFALGVALLCVILLRRWSRYYRQQRAERRRRPQLKPAPAERALLDAPPEITRWQVEMHDFARDLKGELDTKMVALQSLIRMAREESERLQGLLDECHAATSPGSPDPLEQIADRAPLGSFRCAEHPTASPFDPQLQQTIQRLSAAGHSPPAIAEQLSRPLGDIELALSVMQRGEG